jgi:serine phosphatase RsbU (regulator of sigma subunit)
VPATVGRAPDRVHYLVEEQGLEPGRRITLGLTPLNIGRSIPCELVLTGSGISRAHCRLDRVMHEVVVTDLQSTNGTFIDDSEVVGSRVLPIGASLQVGDHVFRHECRDRRELEQSQELDRDLEKARHYVQSLMPAPWHEGPVLADWILRPSVALGGDALGYHRLDDGAVAMYLVDVSGHGAGPAMHTVSVINVLRHQALPGTNFHLPSEVLAKLNAMFQMEQHDDMYFTIWYGVYEPESRVLRYAAGGHHPAFLVSPDRSAALPLHTRNLAIGMAPGYAFRADEVSVPAGAALYLFSDGVFEIVTPQGQNWCLRDFLPMIMEPARAGVSEPQRLYEAVSGIAQRDSFDDDFSLLFARFR